MEERVEGNNSLKMKLRNERNNATILLIKLSSYSGGKVMIFLFIEYSFFVLSC